MSELVRATDWARTPLGPMDGWADELRVAVDICLNSRFPMFVWWGPQLINIYNDAYVPILGTRHPAALGQPAQEAWSDIWSVVGPQTDAVMQRGESTWNERVKLVMERRGYPEETYFTWSYSPIRDKSGRVGGLFCAVTEETERVRAEAERDRLATQRQLALDAARLGWWHYDPATKMATFDERYGEIFGVTGHERANEELLRRVHPDDLPRVWSKVEAALDPLDPRPYSAEYRVVHNDGSVRWVEAHGTAHFEGEGARRRATSLVGTVADVTERKLTEEQPRRILESITDAFIAVDRDWRFTYVNPQAERVLGRQPGDLLGKTLWDEYPGLRGSDFERTYRRAADERIATSITAFYPDHDRWYEVHAYPAAGGGISVYFRDVSDRRRDEELLRRSHDTFYHLIQNNPFGVYVVDADFRLRQVSLGAQKVFQHVPRPLLGRDFAEVLRAIWTEPFASDAISRFRHTLETGEPFTSAKTVERRQDIEVVEAYDWRIERIVLPDGRFGVVCYFYDLSERQRWEAALAEARRRSDSALIAGEVGTFEWDVVADRLWGDRNFARIFGIEHDTDGAATLSEYLAAIHREDRDRVAEQVRQAVETGCDYEAEYRITTSEPHRWVIARGRVERDSSGQAVRFPGVVLDVTKQKRAEAALRESEGRLQAIFQQTQAGIAQVDLSGKFTLVNDRYCQIVARTREQLMQLRMQEITHPDDLARNLPLFERASREGVPFFVEKRYVRPDGSHVWVSNSVSLVRDRDGQGSGIIAACVDITDRRRAEEALRESEARFRQLADAMPQMVWVTRPDGYHEYFNQRWYEFTGVPEGSTDGEQWNGMFHPDDRDRAWTTWRHSLATGEPYEIEYRLRHRSGEYRWTLGRALPIRDASGTITRWFGTCTEIDAMKRLERERESLLERERAARAEAERSSEAKSDFLATLSHELRTPLTPVLLTTSLLESHPDLPEDLREDVATIRRNVELESRLISDLLDLTRISKGKLTLDERDVDLHLIVRSAVDICQREASARLKVELTAARHAVHGDSTRLQQVFWNLINNAIKFTPTDGTITVRSSNPDESRIRVEVIDTGAGIDPSVMPRLFNAFEQGEVRAARQQAGLGLGLAISKKLAEIHRGTIVAASPGRGLGATFTVELPVVDQYIPRKRTPNPRTSLPVAAEPLNVLLVEDHEPTLRVLERLLRHIGHKVTGATTMASALAAAAQVRFDVVISDLGLPDGSGLDLIRELKDPYAGRAIALTGYGMESDHTASRDAGFVEHLTKPVDLSALEAAILRVTAQNDDGEAASARTTTND